MLCVNKYSKAYIDECRSQMESQLAAYRQLLAATREKPGAGKLSAVGLFEPLFFNNLVLVLDSFFVHRSRGLERADGNPMNEVRVLGCSILQNRGVLTANTAIRYKAEKSVLKLNIGEEIKLTESAFVLLCRAYFAEIEAKFI